MIKIEKPNDFEKMKNISPPILTYIRQYFQFFLKEYNCNDITDFGSFYVLDDEKDVLKYSEMGLHQPIAESPYEFSEELIFKSSNQKIEVLHSCFVLSDGYAISVFVQRGVLDSATEKYLLKESTKKEILIEGRKQSWQ